MADMSTAEVEKLTQEMSQPYSRQSRYLRSLTSGRDLLDVGCGIGMFLNEAQRDWNAFGLEESPHGRIFAQKRLGLYVTEKLEELPVQHFDVVRLSHVIEHIPEPVPFMNWVYQLLNPGGILAVITPNREPLVYWAWNRMKRLTSPRPVLKTAIYPDMHVLGFSRCSLSNLARNAGLEPVSVGTISMGNRIYYPFLYDGLLAVNNLSDVSYRSLVKYYLPLLLDNLGNRLGFGEWIVAYFRKA